MGVLHPARGEEETKTNEKGEEGEQTKLNPQNEIMVKHINGFSDKKQRKKVKGKEETRQEPRRPVLDREEKIDFYPHWKQQEGVREEKKEGEQRHKGRGYTESQREEKMQERRKENQVEEDGEEYLSEGEDGRPYIKSEESKL